MAATLISLPDEVLEQIFTYLPLGSIYRLGGTCRKFHALTRSDRIWRLKVLKSQGIWLLPSDYQNLEARPPADKFSISGIINDPTLQGNIELHLLFSSEFRDLLRESRNQETSKSDYRRILAGMLPKMFYFADAMMSNKSDSRSKSVRTALFGPGIESNDTKHLVHKLVNARNSSFHAVDAVPGLPGGFGAGVRIDFRQIYEFDLLCLYTNSERLRESHLGVTRLRASNNRLLSEDLGVETMSLHPNVLKLLPTLDSLFFAVDSTDLHSDSDDVLFEFLRTELDLMIRGMKQFHLKIPILILSCSKNGRQHDKSVDAVELAEKLRLTSSLSNDRPWAIFDVNIVDMGGMEKALDWVLFHIQKKRNELKYHQMQAKVF